jgi:two-component system, OmpR family, sensor histidine kinase KdpD
MPNEEYQRPSPEVLLELAQKEEDQNSRGKLTIYFGAAPGVGKTYAMLSDARRQHKDGLDILIGCIETHDRPETQSLTVGMEFIEPLNFEYKGMNLSEVNVTEIIKRKPKIVLVDELAHTNAPGSRHTKRYQDVEEILNAGIDVYSTLNVQHLESLNDIIFQILNIRVRETVPDTFLQRATDVKLIDLPPEELLKRLSEGKVYLKGIAGIAVENFFKHGNLLALREMALRVVAETVDKRMLQYMQAHAIAGPWHVQDRILVGVLASPYAETLVRAAFRFANELRSDWIAIHVETEKNVNFSDQEKDWLNNALELANKLGAQIVWLKGSSAVKEITDYAQKNNVTKIIIGKPRSLGLFFPSIPKQMLTKTPNIDIYLLDSKIEKEFTFLRSKKRAFSSHPLKYLLSFMTIAFVTFIAFFLSNLLSQVNLLILFLLPVTVIALYLGRGPSIFAAIASIIAFDFFFVRPYYSFTIHDVEYFLSFVVFVIIAVLVSNLTYHLKDKIILLKNSEARSSTLYALSMNLVKMKNIEQVLNIIVYHIKQLFPSEIAIFLPHDGKLDIQAKTSGFDINPSVIGAASWVYLNKQPAGFGTQTFPQARESLFPMITSEDIVGVIGIKFEGKEKALTPDNKVVINTIAHLGAMAISRIDITDFKR